PHLKIGALALCGFLSGYGSLALFNVLASPAQIKNTTQNDTGLIFPAARQLHSNLDANTANANAPNEMTLTGQLNPINPVAPQTAQAEPDEETTMLGQAKQYFLADRLTYPPLHNAYQLYREILLKNPNNLAALEGIASIKQRYLALTTEAINQGVWEKAQRYIERAEFVGVDRQELNRLRAQLQGLMPAETAASGDTRTAEPVNIGSEQNSVLASENRPAAPVGEQEQLTLNPPSGNRLHRNNTGGALPVSEQAFLASLVEDKDSERLALDFIKSHGNSADTVRWLARRWVSAQQWLPLLDLMSSPSAINPAERDVFRAQALLGLKNYQELIVWLSATQEGEQPELQRILAVALQKTGRETDAMAIYQHLVARHPDNSGLWLALGLSADGLGNNTVAREAFFRAQQLGGHSKTVSDFLAKKLAAAPR
ncbi:MAG TPA: hypothetical protein PKD17_18345, partial [Cellvibrionaceae bacterium]|nr:hypothetical protein [Cellvibrionaceae bacterium]